MVDPLTTILAKELATFAASWAKDKIVAWSSTTPTEAAIQVTAETFAAYSGLDDTLSRWVKNEATKSILVGVSEGVTLPKGAAASLRAAFWEVGFAQAPGEASDEAILTVFFRAYRDALLKAEGTQYTVAALTAEIRLSEQRTATMMTNMLTAAQKPLL